MAKAQNATGAHRNGSGEALVGAQSVLMCSMYGSDPIAFRADGREEVLAGGTSLESVPEGAAVHGA